MQLVELVGDQRPSPEAPARTKKRRSKEDVRRGVTARVAIQKSSRVRTFEKKEVREDNPIEYFFLIRVKSTF